MNADQTRWTCTHCSASGWWTPSTHVGDRPETHHSRPDGKRCIRALPPEEVRAIALANGMPTSGRWA
jgi:hypothetical protein